MIAAFIKRNLMKSSSYWIKEISVTFRSLDDIIRNTNTLVLKYGKSDEKYRQALPLPVMMTLENPLLRFFCIPEMRSSLAKSVAESIYALSGMNGSDFIWEFHGWSDPRQTNNLKSIGQSLRFWGEKTGRVLNYTNSNYLRQSGSGFIDQFQRAAVGLVKSDDSFVISLRAPERMDGQVHSAWICKDDSRRLQMMVSCGEVDVVEELPVQIIPSFAFIHQMLSEVTNIPMGTLTIVIARLYGQLVDLGRIKELSKAEPPLIKELNDFSYPVSNLTVQDIDNLISMMQEFVGRLDEKSLLRANPYEGDQRVLLWSDMAECLRADKAEKLGCEIKNKDKFYHPQLRYNYMGII
jgi:hypothetical protein